jgi:hypothetical protein
MHVDPDDLTSAAQRLGQVGKQLGSGLESLQATVTTENPWGSDEPGSLFGMAYVEVLDHALEVLGSHVGQLFAAADGLGEWADGLHQTEEHNTETFTELRSQMGG